MVAAAIIGGAALSAGSSMYGASKAADAQRDAAQMSIDNQNNMYGQNKNILMPFIQSGYGQIDRQTNLLDPNNTSGPLNALMKLIMPGADQSATLEQTPGYQFNMSQGLRAANNALTARGLGGSGGAVAKGAANYASGLASNTWQSVVNALQNSFTSQTGAGQNFLNTGANAGNALAGIGSNTANANSQAMIGAGNAGAAQWNAIGNAGGTVGNSLGTAAMYNQLTGKTGGGGGSIYADAGLSNGVGTGGYNYIDAMAG